MHVSLMRVSMVILTCQPASTSLPASSTSLLPACPSTLVRLCQTVSVLPRLKPTVRMRVL